MFNINKKKPLWTVYVISFMSLILSRNFLSIYAEGAVSIPTASSISNPGIVVSKDSAYEIYAYDVKSIGSQISKVEFITWTEAKGQDDIVSNVGINLGNGTWKAGVSLNQHNEEKGNYITHVYASDNVGNRVFIGNATARVVFSGQEYIYDKLGRVLLQNMPNGKSIKYNYDYNGNLVLKKLYDPINNISALSGYSISQGKNNWYYQEWNGTAFTNLVWQSSTFGWRNSTNTTEIRSAAQIPDVTDSVRKWVAPASGSVTITGNVAKGNVSGGDGVNVKIMKNNLNLFPSSGWSYIAYNDSVGININVTTTVAAGDSIYFIVNRNITILNDSTSWNPSLSTTN